jgi:hypothetical protein
MMILKNKHVLIFNGNPKSGKTQIQQYILEKIEGTMIISTVDKVKEAAEKLGWDGTKDEKSRRFLSDLKILAMEYNDHSFNYIKSKVEFLNKYLYFQILCADSRELPEIDRFKKEFGAKSVLVRNPNVQAVISNMADEYASRTDYEYDYYIDNDGTLEDLKVKVGEFLEGLEKEET